MAFVRVNNSFTSTGSGTSVATGPASLTAGNLLIVFITYSDNGSTIQSITDTAGNAFFFCTGSQIKNGTIVGEIWYAKNTLGNASNAITVTTSASCAEITISWSQYSGGATGSPFDKANSASSSGFGIACNSLTPAGSNELNVAFTACKTAGTPFTGSEGAAYGPVDNNGNWWGSEILAASVAEIGDWSMDVNQQYIAMQAFFSTVNLGGGARLLAATGVGK